VTPEQRILELGTNAGRNLHYLRQAGFVNLEGVEISPAAVDELRRRFPDLDDVVVRVGPIEEHLPPYGDREFECVFTMAVLEHVHYDSDWVLQHVARVGKSLVTIEEETWVSERHFPRDYRRVFESLGMTQVYERPVDELFVPEELGRSRGITARVFVHSD
jgi:SAM-dependent methyltransferase